MRLRYTRIFIVLPVLFMMWHTGTGQMPDEIIMSPEVIIIKAAGLTEGQKPEGVDAITHATSEGRNVHVVSKVLMESLEEKGIKTEIVRFNAFERLDAIAGDTTIQVIVFAGPVYGSRFPKQLQDVVPGLKDFILERGIVCTSMTTCGSMDSGGQTVRTFNNRLAEHGITVTDGLVIHHEYNDEEWETKIAGFAQKISELIDM